MKHPTAHFDTESVQKNKRTKRDVTAGWCLETKTRDRTQLYDKVTIRCHAISAQYQERKHCTRPCACLRRSLRAHWAFGPQSRGFYTEYPVLVTRRTITHYPLPPPPPPPSAMVTLPREKTLPRNTRRENTRNPYPRDSRERRQVHKLPRKDGVK